ncbi:MAG: hypothetical protein LBI42_09485 [Chitinispirillales bacterium]|nr:hypothetical protein [Chitinispirillales bacterium]
MQINHFLKYVSLCSLCYMMCSCGDGSTEKWHKERIVINNTPYQYECDSGCTDCHLTKEFDGSGANISQNNKPKTTERIRKILEDDCMRIKSKTSWDCSKDCSLCVDIDGFGDTINRHTDPCYHRLKTCREIKKIDSDYVCDDDDGKGGGGGSGGGGGGDIEDPSRGWVAFKSAGDEYNNYGFDSWRTIDYHSSNRHLFENRQGYINYVSVKDKGSTFVKVDLSIPSGLYDVIEAKAVRNRYGRVSFSDDIRDTIRVLQNKSDNLLMIFGHGEGTAEIEIWAKNRETGESACFAGNCEEADDRLMVKVFVEHVFGEFNTYTAGNVSFKPTLVQWQNGFNRILKQMVAKLYPDWITMNVSRDGWDIVNNGLLDVIYGFGVTDQHGAAFNREHRPEGGRLWQSEDNLLVSWNGEFGTAITNRSHAHFIVKDPIRTHYVLKRDYIKNNGENILYLHTVDSIVPGQYRISKYYDTGDEGELINVLKVDDKSNNSIVFRKGNITGTPLDNDYKASNNITIYYTGNTIGGFSIYSLSFATDKHSYNAHVHEFLHHEGNLGYPHVKRIELSPYSTNIMYPATSGGDQLRHRDLNFDNGDEGSQWMYIGGRMHDEE